MGYLNGRDAESVMIITLTFVVIGCGILFGILPALVFTLLILFFIGSGMFFTELGHTNSLFSHQTLQDVVIWGVALLFFAISAGNVHERIKTMRYTIDQQKRAIKQFVAIDSTTGFDNAERMRLEQNDTNSHSSLSFFICTTQRNSKHYMEKKKCNIFSSNSV